MRKRALFTGLAIAATTASVAYAQMPSPSPLTIEGSGSVTKGLKGTKKKPTIVGMNFTVKTATTDGTRPEGWKSINVSIPAVTANGGLFPKCDINKFAAAQNPNACPKGSQIATGVLTAVIGAANDFSTQGAPCKKSISIYNAGAGKVIAYLSGPGSDCAGVGYQPPFPGTLKNSSKGVTLNVPIPADTITRPLPGVLGSSTSQTNNFKKLTTKSKGVKRGYFESTCKKGGSRKITTFVIGDPDSKKYSTTSSATKC